MFGHEIEVHAKVVAAVKLKEWKLGSHSHQAWRFVLDVPGPDSSMARVQHDHEFQVSQYRVPQPGERVAVAYKEGHPDNLRLVLENSKFDLLHKDKRREEANKAREAKAVRLAMASPPGSAPATSSGSGARKAKPDHWRVPARCPDCGGPVDPAVASVAAQPTCAYCHLPIPCDPA